MTIRLPKVPFPLTATLVAGGAAVGGAVAFAEYVVRQMTAPGRRRQPVNLGFTPFETGVTFEEVAFPGGHDAPLGGWLLLRDAQAPTVLACGGYRSKRADLLGISSALWRAGFNVLLFDYTGYGDEPGPVTLGYWEMADARAALAFLRHRFPTAPLGVMGFSMGAAVAIMAAAREPDVRAVFADSPFSNQREIVRYHVGRTFRLSATQQGEWLARVVLSLVDRRLSRLFGFRLADIDPRRDVARLAPRPLSLVHGEADTTTPVEHTRRMAEAARAAGVPVETLFVPNVGHCEAYFFDRVGYCERAVRFLSAHVGTPVPTAAGGPQRANGQAPSVSVRPLAALS